MPQRLIKHNPGFLSGEELERSFAVRKAELATILQIVRENSARVNQHVLVVAPRGMGKTLLVRRAARAVESDPALSSQWLPIVMPEEKYDVATAGEVWVEVLGHASRLPTRGRARWGEAYQRIRSERDSGRLREQALARLGELADEEQRRLLVVFENLNLVFAQQVEENADWDLRGTLLSEPRIMLLATATSRFEDLDNPDKALFDLFREIRLEPLESEECAALWKHIAGDDLSPERVRPMEILTGGNPRLLAILASLSAGRSIRELLDHLVELIDDLTAHFKANLEALPPRERRVFIKLAELWEPAGAREVAALARLEVNETSTLLGRLVRRGAVSEVGRKGRKIYYQVAERLFNVYHLLRQGTEGADRARATVELMARFYAPEERARGIAGEAAGPAGDGGAQLAKAQESLADLAAALARPSFQRKDLWLEPMIEMAATGHAAALLGTINASPAATRLEPLVVALRRLGGEELLAPQEIMEVAKDILRRVEQIRDPPW